jgi:hypothetical protein
MSVLSESSPVPKPAILNGRVIVALMFMFGITATAILFVYWKLHLMPFMPLQEAIVAEFPGSAPRVDGGQKKMSAGTPVILRIVMKTDADPQSNDPAAIAEISRIKERIHSLAMEQATLPDLEILELHIYKLLPEKEIRERSFRRELPSGSEWYEVDNRGERVSQSAPAAGLAAPAGETAPVKPAETAP